MPEEVEKAPVLDSLLPVTDEDAVTVKVTMMTPVPFMVVTEATGELLLLLGDEVTPVPGLKGE